MRIVNYYFGINLIWINFYMDKVLSWKDLGHTITKVSGDTDNRCPSYGRVKQSNSTSAINNIIVWPSGRDNTRLILNSQFNTQDYWEINFKDIDETSIQIIDINKEYSIIIEPTHHYNGLIIHDKAPLHYKITEGDTVLYNNNGILFDDPNIKCYEVDGGEDIFNEFKLTMKSRFAQIQLEVWIEGYEQSKKFIIFADGTNPS